MMCASKSAAAAFDRSIQSGDPKFATPGQQFQFLALIYVFSQNTGLTTVLTMTFLGLELRNDLPKVP